MIQSDDSALIKEINQACLGIFEQAHNIPCKICEQKFTITTISKHMKKCKKPK